MTNEEKYLREKYKLVDFHNLTLNGISWLQIMKEYLEDERNKLKPTKELIDEEIEKLANDYATRKVGEHGSMTNLYKKSGFIDGFKKAQELITLSLPEQKPLSVKDIDKIIEKYQFLAHGDMCLNTHGRLKAAQQIYNEQQAVNEKEIVMFTLFYLTEVVAGIKVAKEKFKDKSMIQLLQSDEYKQYKLKNK